MRHQVIKTGTSSATFGVLFNIIDEGIRTHGHEQQRLTLGGHTPEKPLADVIHHAGFAQAGGDDEERSDDQHAGIREAREGIFRGDHAACCQQDDRADEQDVRGPVLDQAEEQPRQDSKRDAHFKRDIQVHQPRSNGLSLMFLYQQAEPWSCRPMYPERGWAL